MYTILVTGALLVVTRSYISNNSIRLVSTSKALVTTSRLVDAPVTTSVQGFGALPKRRRIVHIPRAQDKKQIASHGKKTGSFD